MPVERQWTVPEDAQHLPDISYTEQGDLLVQPRVVRDSDDDAIVEALLEALAILRRVGGTLQIASQRGEIAANVIVTESYIFAYDSFTPLVRRLGDVEDLEEGDEVDNADLPGELPPFEEGAGGEAVAQAQNEVPADAEPVAAVE